MTIGTFEAKTHFSEIITEVEGGQDYIITKRGKPVAKIVPYINHKKTRQEAVQAFKEFGKNFGGAPIKDVPVFIRELINEGKKH